MATNAVARDAVRALRHRIAKIEGRLAETLDGPDVATDGIVVRAGSDALARQPFLPTGAAGLDHALGGGVPRAALTEIHTGESRDAGLSAGFALAIATLVASEQAHAAPLLWVGTSEAFHEGGFPYAPGLARCFGLRPEHLLFSETPKLTDALWVAEEAAKLPALACVILEQRGNPGRLDLTATRRLHRRAMSAGRPVILLRQGAVADPTAAPIRLVVSPAPAAPRMTLAGPVPGTIGAPAFLVTIGKNRAAPAGPFILEWNSHDRVFRERSPAHSRRLVSLPRDGANLAPAARTILAFPSATGDAGAGDQPAGGQRPADRGARQTG